MSTQPIPQPEPQFTPAEFAQKIKAKYPGSYDSIPDEELAQKVIAKYPVYRGSVKTHFEMERDPGTQPGGIETGLDELGNIAKGIPNAFRGMFDPATNAQRGAALFSSDQARKNNNRSSAYRGVAAIGQAGGINAPKMEDEAEHGNFNGILGTATADALLGVSPLIFRGARAAATSRLGQVAQDVGKSSLRHIPYVGPVLGDAARAWRNSAPKPAALAPAIKAQPEPQQPSIDSGPEYVSDEDVAEHALSGGLKLPSIEDSRFGNLRDTYQHLDEGLRLPTADQARVANSSRTLGDLSRWKQEEATSRPLGLQEGPTPDQIQATEDFFHSPLKNWRGEPIEAAPTPAGGSGIDAPARPDLVPLLEESVRQAKLKRSRTPSRIGRPKVDE